jgi:SAM-dependent methyltransferase
MNEATKTLHHYSRLLVPFLEKGTILDIGAGKDPIHPNAMAFDLEQGNAEIINNYLQTKFSCVFSSHCLEHMNDPKMALLEWWKLVEDGGSMIFIVPDEDLYEQGVFPSLFNGDHKATFTISKESSWSTRSYNVLDLVKILENADLVYCKLQDNEYERAYLNFRFKFQKLYFVLRDRSPRLFELLAKVLVPMRFWPIDQTRMDDFRLAQILTIVTKRST